MKKHLIALVILFTGLLSGSAIERPNIDLNGIKVDVTLNPSKYRALLDRYINGDETLTVNDMAKVYYGYASTYDYNPTRSYTQINKLFDAGEYEKVYKQATAALERDPLSLDLLAKAIMAVDKSPSLKNPSEYNKLKTRYDKLTELILLSGRGTMPESPFIVLSENDLQALLRYVFYVTDIRERGYFGAYDVVCAMYPDGSREIVLFFDNTFQAQFDANKK